MSVKSYVFTNEYGQLKFTVSSGGGTTPAQIPLELEEFINIFPVSMGDSGTSWTDICNAYRNGARIIGISSGVQYQVSNIITGSSGSITFYRTENDPEAGTVTFYFWVYSASNGVGTWQAEYSITTNSNYAKTTGWYGTCSTAASTTQKDVTCSNYTLNTGNIIGVFFSTANTAAAPTLKVGSTAVKSILVGSTLPSSTTGVLKWSANTMLYFMYDGSYYRYLYGNAVGNVDQPRGANTWYGSCSTAAGTRAKESTINNYFLTKGSLAVINCTTANTVNNTLTLNINGTGAKTIYYNASQTGSSNTLTWDAGETLTFMYDGTYYRFVSRSKTSSATYDTVTLNQLQTGTDTTGYLISPKVLADYIASLDATNVAY